jgi:hypothetical protein
LRGQPAVELVLQIDVFADTIAEFLELFRTGVDRSLRGRLPGGREKHRRRQETDKEEVDGWVG